MAEQPVALTMADCVSYGTSQPTASVPSVLFYQEYFGHDVHLLEQCHEQLRSGSRACIFLAGDSSLDNKFWFNSATEAINGYERVLRPPRMKQDVCYWINAELVRRGLGTQHFCLNTAVEATSLNSRSCCTLLPQDALIRDKLTAKDTLIVSIGDNDLALNPVLATILNIVPLLCCTPEVCIEKYACACPPNLHVDLGCCGCGLPGCMVSAFGWPPGMAYFVDLFKNRIENYINHILNGRKPALVVVCMYYFLDVHGRGSWADGFLSAMCYDCAPTRLQAAIKQIFALATSRIQIDGGRVRVLPFPLFEALDGNDTEDYVQRVEPSARGGAKMACALVDAVFGSFDGAGGGGAAAASAAPTNAAMIGARIW